MKSEQSFHLNRLAEKLVTPERFGGGTFAFPDWSMRMRVTATINGTDSPEFADAIAHRDRLSAWHDAVHRGEVRGFAPIFQRQSEGGLRKP